MLRFLLDSESDVELRDLHQNTALHLAASKDFSGGCRALAVARAPLDAVNASGAVPLLLAAERGHAESCKVLLEADTKQLPAALQMAASSGFVPLGAPLT